MKNLLKRILTKTEVKITSEGKRTIYRTSLKLRIPFLRKTLKWHENIYEKGRIAKCEYSDGNWTRYHYDSYGRLGGYTYGKNIKKENKKPLQLN